MRYTATIEARGYGHAEEEGASLLDALPDESDDLTVNVGVDEERGMLRTELGFDAEDALDAQEQALTIWRDAWQIAFPDLGPTERIAFVATPGAPERAEPVAAGNADPLADVP